MYCEDLDLQISVLKNINIQDSLVMMVKIKKK